MVYARKSRDRYDVGRCDEDALIQELQARFNNPRDKSPTRDRIPSSCDFDRPRTNDRYSGVLREMQSRFNHPRDKSPTRDGIPSRYNFDRPPMVDPYKGDIREMQERFDHPRDKSPTRDGIPSRCDFDRPPTIDPYKGDIRAIQERFNHPRDKSPNRPPTIHRYRGNICEMQERFKHPRDKSPNRPPMIDRYEGDIREMQERFKHPRDKSPTRHCIQSRCDFDRLRTIDRHDNIKANNKPIRKTKPKSSSFEDRFGGMENAHRNYNNDNTPKVIWTGAISRWTKDWTKDRYEDYQNYVRSPNPGMGGSRGDRYDIEHREAVESPRCTNSSPRERDRYAEKL